MNTTRTRSSSQHCRIWLLWIALLLPVAQAAATWHTLSIPRADSRDRHGQTALHHAHCDLCLTAAALSGGALPATEPVSPRPAGRHETPRIGARGARCALTAWAYRSRAPPVLQS